MATRERQALYQALRSHRSELEFTRRDASGPDLEMLDGRLAAAQQLLEWLSQALELEPQDRGAAELAQGQKPACDHR
jgi:hypothetical protein